MLRITSDPLSGLLRCENAGDIKLGISGAIGMKFEWVVTDNDQSTYRSFIERWKCHRFVEERRRQNIQRQAVVVSEAAFWKVFVGCLLTTQQRSGAGSAVEHFLSTDSELLNVTHCLQATSLAQSAEAELKRFRFRRSTRIAEEVEHAAGQLRNGGWNDTESALRSLLDETTIAKERSVARHLQERFKGLGPKQSRNLIQWLGLSQFEIPLDSRVVKVLKSLDFPVPLSSTALADEAYYCFIEDGLQFILAKLDVLPCLFDACAFASGERNAQQQVPADGPRAARSAHG